MKRKIYATKEQARYVSRHLTGKIFEDTIRGAVNEECKFEVEKLKDRAEEIVLQMQMKAIDMIADEYEEAISNLESAQHLSSKEKTLLLDRIRENMRSKNVVF